MTRERFDALVAGLEVSAQQAPRAYQARVVLLALLGYAYVLGMLALALVSLGVVVAVAVYGHVLAALAKLLLVLGI